MNLIEMKKNYLEYVKINFSNGTYLCYQNHLNYILNFLANKNIFVANDINDSVIANFILEQRTLKIQNSTINKRIQVIKRCLIYNNFKIDNIKNFKKLKENKVHFKCLNDCELIILLTYIKNSNLNIRNKILILFLLDTGARINELRNIKINDINLSNNSIVLRFTKTKSNRTVFIKDSTACILKEYIKLNNLCDNSLLFDITISGIHSLFTRIKMQCNFNKFHPHMLRHTFASILVENHISVFILMELMGHTNVATTMRYVHLNDDFKRKEYLNCMNY